MDSRADKQMALLVVPSVSSVPCNSRAFVSGKQLIFTPNQRYSRRDDALARRGGGFGVRASFFNPDIIQPPILKEALKDNIGSGTKRGERCKNLLIMGSEEALQLPCPSAAAPWTLKDPNIPEVRRCSAPVLELQRNHPTTSCRERPPFSAETMREQPSHDRAELPRSTHNPCAFINTRPSTRCASTCEDSCRVTPVLGAAAPLS